MKEELICLGVLRTPKQTNKTSELRNSYNNSPSEGLCLGKKYARFGFLQTEHFHLITFYSPGSGLTCDIPEAIGR